jgi:pimeloyl-ACP methyl ester carboxylesterase
LGLSEWRDAEAAVRFAVGRGAKDVVLMGWSMGGAIALQMLDQSELACRVGSVVLNAPVIDWGHVIRHHAELHRVPAPLSALTTSLIGAPWARRLVGVRQSLDVAQTNWEDRSDELNHRMLIIHSADDDFVPIAPAQALAARRPDLVRLEAWSGAGHTKEWNTDPGRWEYVVTDFLAG